MTSLLLSQRELSAQGGVESVVNRHLYQKKCCKSGVVTDFF